jgi:hypothetical protein
MRVRFHHIAQLLRSLLFALPLLSLGPSCAAQAPVTDKTPHQAAAAQTTLVVLADHPMPDDLWPALVTALREELNSGSPETRVLIGETTGPAVGAATDQTAGKDMTHQVQIVRSDMIAPGVIVEKTVTVILHGYCKIVPRPRPILLGNASASAPGALGWALSDHGHIEPFAHVECSRLGKMLATQAFGLDRDMRDRLMAVAIARVVLHEWSHIATQSPHHSEHGLTRAQFGVEDLLAHPAKVTAQPGAQLRDEHEDSGASSSDSASESSDTRFRV